MAKISRRIGRSFGLYRKINPEQAIINHMASECDYDEIDRLTPENVHPAYDGLTVEF